jgi:hypothetical protein
MNQRQIDAIETQWRKIVSQADANQSEGDDLAQVRCVLLGRFTARTGRCEEVAAKDPW